MPSGSILLAMAAMASSPTDEALISGAIDLCVPFVATRDFDRAASAARALGFAGNVLAEQGNFQQVAGPHRLQFSFESTDYGDVVDCGLFLKGVEIDPVVKMVTKASGGKAPEVVPNLSPQYPPSYNWSRDRAVVSVGTLGDGAPIVVSVYPSEP